MVVADIVRSCGDYDLAGFIDDVNPNRKGTTFLKAPILGGREQLDVLNREGVDFLIFGFGNNVARLRLAAIVKERGYRLATAIHPRAVIASDVVVGAGSIIKAGAVIDPDVKIGENVLIGSCVSLGHSCVVGDGVRINAGASVPGGVEIGEATMIGAGASLRDHIKVGRNTLIGVGAAVVGNIPDGVVAFGVPAKVVRETRPQDY
jgi:sugar O-acyltransferase (sialic acid O-acetyltransferase NeuD family)